MEAFRRRLSGRQRLQDEDEGNYQAVQTTAIPMEEVNSVQAARPGGETFHNPSFPGMERTVNDASIAARLQTQSEDEAYARRLQAEMDREPQQQSRSMGQPPRPADAGQTALQVTVPQGVGPGQQIIVRAPNGQQMFVTVPANCYPGSTFQIQLAGQTNPQASQAVHRALAQQQAQQRGSSQMAAQQPLPPPDPVLLEQLMGMGFTKQESEEAARHESTVEAAIERVMARQAMEPEQQLAQPEPPPAPPQQPQPLSQQPAVVVPPAAAAALEAMGFEQAVCLHALALHDGDMDASLDWLTSPDAEAWSVEHKREVERQQTQKQQAQQTQQQQAIPMATPVPAPPPPSYQAQAPIPVIPTPAPVPAPAAVAAQSVEALASQMNASRIGDQPVAAQAASATPMSFSDQTDIFALDTSQQQQQQPIPSTALPSTSAFPNDFVDPFASSSGLAPTLAAPAFAPAFAPAPALVTAPAPAVPTAAPPVIDPFELPAAPAPTPAAAPAPTPAPAPAPASTTPADPFAPATSAPAAAAAPVNFDPFASASPAPAPATSALAPAPVIFDPFAPAATPQQTI